MVYTGAPYNFIDFPSRWIERYKKIDDLPRHDRYIRGALNGKIDFEWTALTPVCVGGAKKDESGISNVYFFQNQLGYAIPGNSVRGLIRSHVQILGMSNIRDDIRNETFLYRDMASKNNHLKDQYKASIGAGTDNKRREQQEIHNGLPDKLKAGYIEWVPEWECCRIIPAEEDLRGKQFYRVSEQKLRQMNAGSIKGVQFMYPVDVWGQVRQLKSREAQRALSKMGNKNYHPYYVPVRFSLDSDGVHVANIVSRSSNERGRGLVDGYLLSSGYIGGKRAHYVIREATNIGAAGGIKIGIDLISQYERDLIRKKYNSKKYSFYWLPNRQNPVTKPIFYAENNEEQIYFGFTPYLRVPYFYDVHHGLPEVFTKGWKLDYAKSLFGFTNKDAAKSYKGRLSFSDAQAIGEVRETEPAKVVLAEPKATAYSLYIKQPKTEEGILYTYNDADFGLRGMKKYWPKSKVRPVASNKLKIDTILHPLSENTRFNGSIRFSNLAPDELGLLLWALYLDEQSVIQIGMGKPYGYGQLKLDRNALRLSIEDPAKKYGKTFSFQKDYLQDADPVAYIEAFQRYMRDEQGIMIKDETCVKSFFNMIHQRMEHEKTRYMTLQHPKEFGELNPLPTIEETISDRIKLFKKTDLRKNRGQNGNRSNRYPYNDKSSFTPSNSQSHHKFYQTHEASPQIDERWAALKKLGKNGKKK